MVPDRRIRKTIGQLRCQSVGRVLTKRQERAGRCARSRWVRRPGQLSPRDEAFPRHFIVDERPATDDRRETSTCTSWNGLVVIGRDAATRWAYSPGGWLKFASLRTLAAL